MQKGTQLAHTVFLSEEKKKKRKIIDMPAEALYVLGVHLFFWPCIYEQRIETAKI
jgi:hypothetical protein